MNNRFQPNPFNNVFNGKPKNHRTHTHMRSSWSQTVKFVAVSLCIRHDFPHIQTNWLHCELCVKKRIHTINICVFNHYHLISIVHERSVGRSLTRYLSSESNQRTNQPANQSNTFPSTHIHTWSRICSQICSSHRPNGMNTCVCQIFALAVLYGFFCALQIQCHFFIDIWYSHFVRSRHISLPRALLSLRFI